MQVLSRLLLVGLVLCAGTSSQINAQQSSGVKELMGRAQNESERRAVEDLVKKLQGRNAAPGDPAQSTPATTPVTNAPSAGASPSAATTTPPLPATTTPPAQADQAPLAIKPETAAAKETPVAQPPASAPPTTTTSAGTEGLPSVNLEVYFEYATAKLTAESTSTLVALGLSLNDPRLADQTFIIGGYTDAKGKPDYNLRLSQQRADAVRDFLMAEFKIDPKRLISIGFGKSHLKNAVNPQAVENRRVEIINWTTQVKH